MVIMTLEVYSLALASRNITFTNATERNQSKITAFNTAEAGIDTAITQLRSSTTYTGTGYTSMSSTSNSMKGGYAVTVSTPAGTTDYRLIQATGYSPDNTTTSRAYENRAIMAYVQLDDTAFEYAVFGETGVTFGGASGLVNSYNSGNGAYGGANILNNGDVGYDGTYTNNNTTINGDIVANPDINCSPASTSTPSSGTLSLSGSTVLVLAAGTYHYSSINVTGNAAIVTTGAVTIYVDGAVSIAGTGVVTASNTPSNFNIIATSNADVTVGGSAGFYGTIYAPDSKVTSNAGDYYGAVISDSFKQNGNGNVHYDEALANVPSPCIDVDFLSWRETNTVAGS